MSHPDYEMHSSRVLFNNAHGLCAYALEASKQLAHRWGKTFDSCIVAGSGVSDSLTDWETVQSIDTAELTGFSASTVQGHRNRVAWMRKDGMDVLVFHGRRHVYEGASLLQVVLPVVLARCLGVGHCILTNAAGGMNPKFVAGDIMLADDLVNATGRVVSVSDATKTPLVDTDWVSRIEGMYRQHSQPMAATVHRGVYVSVLGPSYETRSEVRMFGCMADAVGMSTIHEAQTARQLGMSVVAVSVISNTLHEAPTAKLTHDEVLDVAAQSAADVGSVIGYALQTC